MTVFRALVVDDDHEYRTKAKGAESPGVEVLTAATKEEALEHVERHFLHVAVVDFELRRSPRALGEGQHVLRALKRARPSCQRVLLTKHAKDFPDQIFGLFNPANPILTAAIDKDSLDTDFRRYLASMATAWQRVPVDIANLGEVDALLRGTSVRGEIVSGEQRAHVTSDELHYVLAKLFGQRFRSEREAPDPDDVERIALKPFLGGKSRSVVLHGRPVNRLGGEGLLCVVKVGSRLDAEQELRRYEHYVRFRMSLRRRVELLGHVLGDTLGAIAYSFAGHDPSEVTDLKTLLDDEDDRALAYLDSIYGDEGEWGPEADDGDDLGVFFSTAYGLRPHRVLDEIEHFVDDQATARGWQHRRDELLIPGGKLTLPTSESLGEGVMRRAYRSRVVHGDLNASNVIIGDGDRSILIDYRTTTRGPRGVDYASMHASIRLSSSACAQPPEGAVDDERSEYALWHHDWSASDDWWPADRDAPAYWLVAAARLMRLTSTRLPDLTRSELAATCLWYALRVFRVRQISKEARLRLLIWISALERVIESDAAQAPEPAPMTS